jgi:hypothetical protein
VSWLDTPKLRGLDRHDGDVLSPPAGHLLVLGQQDMIRWHDMLVEVRMLRSLIVEAVRGHGGSVDMVDGLLLTGIHLKDSATLHHVHVGLLLRPVIL